MSKKVRRAFPSNNVHHQNGDLVLGMTLRDYFAAKAMQAIVMSFTDRAVMEAWASASEKMGFETLEDGISDGAYRQADAMLKERDK